MARIHALQHLSFEGLGFIHPWISKHGHTLTETRFWEDKLALPSMDSFDLLIVMGGSMNVDEEELYPWLKAEKAFISEAIKSNKKVLGICLGAQLIARATGVQVLRSPEKEIGWFPVKREFESHPLFPSFHSIDSLPVMHWHGDMFEIPVGAQRLFSSNGCPNQGFAMNENRVIGLQFHLELGNQHIRTFFEQDLSEFESTAKYIQSPATILELEKEYVGRTREALNELLDRLIELA